MKRCIQLLFLLCVSKSFLYGQLVPLDQAPFSVHWNQINTDHFRLVYPIGFDSMAQRMANTLEQVYLPVSNPLGKNPRKISVIFQNRNVISNAYVRLAPRFSEFYTTPPQDYNFVGSNQWLNLLATHEFRHVVQYDKSLTGFTRLAYYVAGQNGWAVMSYLAAPEWFWEGDAVYSETTFSPSGRGRIPNFDLVFRTTVLERGGWNYYKQHLRSYKDFVPNHYVTGYFMTSYLRRKYGNQIWDSVTKHSFAWSFVPFTFSNSIKKYTGSRLIPTYRAMISDVSELWKKQIDQLPITDSKKINKRKNKIYTDYMNPQLLSDGSIVVVKSGIGNIEQFVKIDSIGNEEKIHTLGIYNSSGMLSIAQDKLVWNEFIPDARWGNRTYSVIKLYDIKNKRLSIVTKKSRFSAAAISPDGKKIATVEMNESNQYALIIIGVQSKNIIKKIINPSNYFYAMPRWTFDSKHIVSLKTGEKGKTISLINIETEKEIDLMDFSYENVGHPVLYKNYLFYNSPYNGIDNIYVVDTLTHQRFQVTSKKYAAYNPSISMDAKFIYFNNFSFQGMDVEKMEFNSSAWLPINQVEDRTVKYYLIDTLKEKQNSSLLVSIPKNKYETKKYNRLAHMINPFSWGPVINPSDREFGVYLQSTDILQTFYSRVGYTINGNEKRGAFLAEASYQGFYPMIDVGYRFGERATTFTFESSPDTLISWKEKTGFVGLSLPLNLTHSSYYEYIKLSTQIGFTTISNYTFPIRSISQPGNGNLYTSQYLFIYSRLLKMSKRDLVSKWGQTFFIMYDHTPFGGEYKSSRLAMEGNMYFPGIVNHHSIRLRGGYQQQKIDNYAFSTPLFIPRGDTYKAYNYFWNASIEYKLPLFYPDIHIGPLINFQRVKANFFYDVSSGWDASTKKGKFQSMGMELTTDINVFRLLITEIDLGARFTYIPEKKMGVWDFVLLSFGF